MPILHIEHFDNSRLKKTNQQNHIMIVDSASNQIFKTFYLLEKVLLLFSGLLFMFLLRQSLDFVMIVTNPFLFFFNKILEKFFFSVGSCE